MIRLVIGVFRPTRQGGWEGDLRTLSLSSRLRFVPNDDLAPVNAPIFRIMIGMSRVGEAWEATWGLGRSRIYYRATLDDPLLPAPMSAALFPEEDGASAQLVWSRPAREEKSIADEAVLRSGER